MRLCSEGRECVWNQQLSQTVSKRSIKEEAKPSIVQLNSVAVAFETVCLASSPSRFDYHFLLGYDQWKKKAK